eukprot:2462238-Amphidinium_carterae.1
MAKRPVLNLFCGAYHFPLACRGRESDLRLPPKSHELVRNGGTDLTPWFANKSQGQLQHVSESRVWARREVFYRLTILAQTTACGRTKNAQTSKRSLLLERLGDPAF